MKKEWIKPEIRFITEPDIVLGCLYEVYGQEKQAVLSGKNIRHTMIFPFLRMLANSAGSMKDLQTLHRELWKNYQEMPGKEAFVQKGEDLLGKEVNRNLWLYTAERSLYPENSEHVMRIRMETLPYYQTTEKFDRFR